MNINIQKDSWSVKFAGPWLTITVVIPIYTSFKLVKLQKHGQPSFFLTKKINQLYEKAMQMNLFQLHTNIATMLLSFTLLAQQILQQPTFRNRK